MLLLTSWVDHGVKPYPGVVVQRPAKMPHSISVDQYNYFFSLLLNGSFSTTLTPEIVWVTA